MEFLETSGVARFPTLFVCVGLMVIAVILCIAGLLAYLVTKSIKEARYLAYLNASRSIFRNTDSIQNNDRDILATPQYDTIDSMNPKDLSLQSKSSYKNNAN